MNTRIRVRSLGVLAAGLALSPFAAAQSRVMFSITYDGQTIALPDCGTAIPITEGELLAPCTPGGVPALGPLPIPRTALSGGLGGLNLALHPLCVGHPPGVPCAVEVDAFSYGVDGDLAPPSSGTVGMGKVWFSVDQHARGFAAPVPSVFTERPWGEAGSDIFASLMLPPGPLPPFAVPPSNVGVLDGNGLVSGSGATYPGLGILEPNFPTPPPSTGDNVDAFEFTENVTAASVPFFSLDSPFVDPWFGFPNTGSAAAHGFVGGDVLTLIGGVPAVYAPAAALGLDFFGPDSDDLDALALRENGVPGFQPSFQPNTWWSGATDMLLFSVRRGSAVVGMPDSIWGLPIEVGDILTVPLPTAFGGVSPFPGIYIAAENLGLLTSRSVAGLPAVFGDDLNALDTIDGLLFDCDGDGIEDSVAIALGLVADVNLDGIPDSCQTVGTPYCFCPNGGICFNPDANAGCMNSTGAGALLSATGTTSVGADNLVLTTTSLPPFQFNLYFMGPNPVNVLFGDGIRCVGGNIVRFNPPTNSGAGGTSSLGPGIVAFSIANFTPVHWITSGQTWRFQNWYRDPFGPCGTGFNLSNAIAVTFTP